jgi:hypothetical protein
MTTLPRIVSSASFVVAVLAALSSSAVAGADDTSWGVNGKFQAQSNGQWSQTNDRYQDEQSVVSTWTVSTTCRSRFDCVGQVSSDQGWSAPLYTKAGMFYVKHIVPKWEPCPDGTVSDGLQVFHFYPATPDGDGDMTSTTLFMGEDVTTGVSGACGISLPLVVKLPFKLSQVG